jgi:hypothetical protein
MGVFSYEKGYPMSETRVLRKTQPVAPPKLHSPAFQRRARRAASVPGERRAITPGAPFICDLAARLAAAHYELPLAEVAASARGSRRASRARHIAIYLAHVSLGLRLGLVAAEFRRDRSTVAYACRLIEDARDSPAFDAAIANLEITAGVLLELGRTEVVE